MTKQDLKDWFNNFGSFGPRHDLDLLQRGIKSGLLDVQNEYGSTALSLACSNSWIHGMRELLRAGANTELRYFRTGETILYNAVRAKADEIIAILIDAGADPDAPNYWGVTPRKWDPKRFKRIRVQKRPLPEPHIQNAEHLADHYHPKFKIPSRRERESLEAGQAVDLYVYGPKTRGKQDTVKVRITGRDEMPSGIIYYAAKVETPIKQTHLAPGTTAVEFGPENVATVWLPKPKARNL